MAESVTVTVCAGAGGANKAAENKKEAASHRDNQNEGGVELWMSMVIDHRVCQEMAAR